MIDEPDMWEQAKEIARDMLDGKLWLPEIGHSTHYHAYWVHPSWVNEMRSSTRSACTASTGRAPGATPSKCRTIRSCAPLHGESKSY